MSDLSDTPGIYTVGKLTGDCTEASEDGGSCCLFWVGVLLCGSVLGAIIGVPLIILSIVGGHIGKKEARTYGMKADCPHCGRKGLFFIGPRPKRWFTTEQTDGMSCPDCQSRLLIRDQCLVNAPRVSEFHQMHVKTESGDSLTEVSSGWIDKEGDGNAAIREKKNG